MIKYIVKRTVHYHPDKPYLFGPDGSRRLAKAPGDKEAFAAKHGYISKAQAIRRMETIMRILHDSGSGVIYEIEAVEIPT